MANAEWQNRGIRAVSAELLSCNVIQLPHTRFETFLRKPAKVIEWHFQQPNPCLFWHRHSVGEVELKVAGQRLERRLSKNSSLFIYPGNVEIQGRFKLNESSRAGHTVVFLDNDFVTERLGEPLSVPVLGFHDELIIRGLQQLCATPDLALTSRALGLFAEGWTCQMLAHVASNYQNNRVAQTRAYRGGLSARNSRRLDEFIYANLASRITIQDLADLVGLSVRHFLRAFQESRGVTPHQHILDLRLQQAKQLLEDTDSSVTDIALTVGFSHAQHFSTLFRKKTGVTPSMFRRMSA